MIHDTHLSAMDVPAELIICELTVGAVASDVLVPICSIAGGSEEQVYR